MRVLDFDSSQNWFRWFDEQLADINHLIDWSALSSVEFTSDAYDHALKFVDESHLAHIFSDRLSDVSVLAYHGTRLTADELENVRGVGLRPLLAAERAGRYDLIFKDHPEWGQRRERVAETLERLGPKATLGSREDGRVWACYSRSGLLDCDYTIHGAEIDHHVAYSVFDGEHAHDYLRRYGERYLVKFSCTMAEVEDAVSPFSNKSADELSRFAKTLLGHWAFSKIVSEHSSASERDATQMGFNFAIHPDRIIEIEHLPAL